MFNQKSGVCLLDPLSPETVAAIFLFFRWIILIVAGHWIIPKLHDQSISLIFHCVVLLMFFVTTGFYIRSSALFIISLPIQIVMGAGFVSYCFSKVYNFTDIPSYDVMTIIQLLTALLVWFYDLFASVRCVEIFHEESVAEKDEKPPLILRRSPNAALINVFRRHLLASPHTSLIKTPGSNRSSDSFGELSFREATMFEDLARRLV